MSKFGTIILLLLFGATSLSFLEAQTIESYTFTTNRLVPDGNAAGISDVQNVSSAIGAISSLKVRLKITGEFNGDLFAYLRHSSGYTVLLNRPGKTSDNDYGYADSGLDVVFQAGCLNGDVHHYRMSQYHRWFSARGHLAAGWTHKRSRECHRTMRASRSAYSF